MKIQHENQHVDECSPKFRVWRKKFVCAARKKKGKRAVQLGHSLSHPRITSFLETRNRKLVKSLLTGAKITRKKLVIEFLGFSITRKQAKTRDRPITSFSITSFCQMLETLFRRLKLILYAGNCNQMLEDEEETVIRWVKLPLHITTTQLITQLLICRRSSLIFLLRNNVRRACRSPSTCFSSRRQRRFMAFADFLADIALLILPCRHRRLLTEYHLQFLTTVFYSRGQSPCLSISLFFPIGELSFSVLAAGTL